MQADSRKVNILLVDDEPKNLTALAAILENVDRNLVRAASGPEALRHLLRDDFAMVLLDVLMPGMDGFETATLIRARDRSRDTPIIFLTADNRGGPSVLRGYSLGAVDYIFKPVDPEILRSKVAVFVELQRKNEQQKLLVREQAARAAAEAERDRLQQILDVLPEGIVITDANGRAQMANAAAREIGGDPLPFTAEAAGGERVLRLDGSAYPAEEFPSARAARHGEVVHGKQLLVRNLSAGRTVPVLVNSAPLRDAGSEIGGAVAVFQDITPIKDMERAREEFLSSASHDLKTPLTTIRGLAQLTQRRAQRLEGPEAARVAEGLRKIDVTAGKMASLINELLDVACLQMGKPLDLDRRPTDLVALARQLTAEQQTTSDRHRIRVEAQVPELTGAWDTMRLERVLANLLSNAIKYSPEGGEVLVRVAREDRRDGSWALLTVRDPGLGIPKSDLPRIFERFHRASNVVERIAGTGIGLASVHQIVAQHGGSVAVTSKEGAGTTFTVRLPLAPVGVEETAPASVR
jgi:PAS domain S-box-containing protein